MGLFDCLLNEARHDDVASHDDVLSDVQARPRRSQAQLHWFRVFPRLGASHCPLFAQVDAHGCVAMSLQAQGQVVESSRIRDGPGDEATGQVGDSVGDGVPDADVLFRQSVRGRRDDMAVGDQGVEVDHVVVIVEEVDGGLAGDTRGKGSDGREDCSFGHFGSCPCVFSSLPFRVPPLRFGSMQERSLRETELEGEKKKSGAEWAGLFRPYINGAAATVAWCLISRAQGAGRFLVLRRCFRAEAWDTTQTLNGQRATAKGGRILEGLQRERRRRDRKRRDFERNRKGRAR